MQITNLEGPMDACWSENDFDQTDTDTSLGGP